MSGTVFEIGDRVRFERFGEWLDGTVILIRDGLLCIQYRDYGATTWRDPSRGNVVANAAYYETAE